MQFEGWLRVPVGMEVEIFAKGVDAHDDTGKGVGQVERGAHVRILGMPKVKCRCGPGLGGRRWSAGSGSRHSG